MAENQNENPEKKTIAEIKKEAEKIFKQGKDKISGKISDEKANYRGNRGKPYDFYLSGVEEGLMKPLRIAYDKKRGQMDAVEQGPKSDGEKIDELANLKEELRAEINTGYTNAIALIEKETDSEGEITREALGKMELYAPFLIQLAESEKGKPLTEIFNEMTIITNLGEDGGKHEKILTEAILDPELSRIGFFVLMMTLKGVKDEFARRFIEKHPEKGTWFLEKGNEYGCYDAVQMNKFLLLLKEKPASKADAEKKLQTFSEDEKFYVDRFNMMQAPTERIRGLYTRDASNYALNNLTFKGAGRLIGYMSSTLTILTNLVANRKEYMKNPSLMAKNVYLWAAAGGLTWLVRTGQEKRVGDLFKTQATKETEENKKKLKKFNEYVGRSVEWGNFFYNSGDKPGGAELLGQYSVYIKTQDKIAKIPPTIEGFLVFCKKKEDEQKVDKDKRASTRLEIMAGENKDKVQKEMEEYMELFEELKIENQVNFEETKANAKDV